MLCFLIFEIKSNSESVEIKENIIILVETGSTFLMKFKLFYSWGQGGFSLPTPPLITFK